LVAKKTSSDSDQVIGEKKKEKQRPDEKNARKRLPREEEFIAPDAPRPGIKDT